MRDALSRIPIGEGKRSEKPERVKEWRRKKKTVPQPADKQVPRDGAFKERRP
jgi:hypothetical protein